MLASMLMESALGGVPNATPEAVAKYTHENGAVLIAMETAEDIHEIFLEGFYGLESLEFSHEKATMEGASQDVLESIAGNIKAKAKNTIKMIREKLQSLWEKVKGFAKNVKTYILSVFQNGSKFAKAHQKELKALNLGSDFTYDLYDYTIEASCSKMSDAISSTFDGVNSSLKTLSNASKTSDTGDRTLEKKKMIYDDLIKSSFGGDTDEDSVNTYIWGAMRGNTKSTSDKNHMSGKIDALVDALIGAPKLTTSFDNAWKKQDKMFKDAMASCKDLETKADKSDMTNLASLASIYYTIVSKLSNLYNKVIGTAKGAVTEMVKSYMVVVRKALRYKPQKD